jgi:hypothetical protein
VNEKCFAKKTVPSRSGDCICLDGNCPGYTQCPFYKPVWKFQHDTEKRYARLAALPELEGRVLVANIDRPNLALKLRDGEPPLKWAAKLVELYAQV